MSLCDGTAWSVYTRCLLSIIDIFLSCDDRPLGAIIAVLQMPIKMHKGQGSVIIRKKRNVEQVFEGLALLPDVCVCVCVCTGASFRDLSLILPLRMGPAKILTWYC